MGTNTVDSNGLRNFKDLKTSTATIMIYSNIIFDTAAIFESLAIHDIEVPLTKKQKNVDKKKVMAPYGTIISAQHTTRIRGVDFRKKKRHWCTVCQPYRIDNEKQVKIITVTEHLEQEYDTYTDIDTDVRSIKYYCSHCQKMYNPTEIKKINYFLNQLTIVLSLEKSPMLNIMMFKDSIKIAGCKEVDDAVEAVIILWQDYLVNNTSLWKLKPGEKIPQFQFETVMKNVDFKIGFPIEKNELNALMNDEKYADRIFMSQYEPTGQTNVNIKMYSRRPVDFKYDCLCMPLPDKKGVGKNPYFIKTDELTFKNPKKKGKGSKYMTGIVFSSSEVILSGRYDASMEEMYKFLGTEIFKHRKQVEELLAAPDQYKISRLGVLGVRPPTPLTKTSHTIRAN